MPESVTRLRAKEVNNLIYCTQTGKEMSKIFAHMVSHAKPAMLDQVSDC